PSTEALLGHRFALDDRERVTSVLPTTPDAYPVEWVTLRPTTPLIFPTRLDKVAASALPHFDGLRTVAEVIARVAEDEKLSESEVRGALLPQVGTLLEVGILKQMTYEGRTGSSD
ncbi:MAG: hypothetical protein H0T78_00295, partial [Longispora sp.]|nr:hypothetical protein [Longispora sp. (in: high G+C Gram-positive bacteria)]